MSVDKKDVATWGGIGVFVAFALATLRIMNSFEEKFVTREVFQAQGDLLLQKLDSVRQAVEFTRLEVGQADGASEKLDARVRLLEERVTRLESKQ